MAEERVQKILAAAGLGSRRACEAIIAQGRVSVNGNLIQLGDKADPETDRITVDGNPLDPPQKKVYIALNKPKGYLSDIDETHPMPTVNDLVDVPEKLYAVGRLDYESEGLILMTNDGELANRLTHPRYEHEKEYEVFVITPPDEEQLTIWRRGVVLEDGYRTLPARVEVIGNANQGTWLRISLREGKKRQIRNTGSRIGLPVGAIRRVRIGTLLLGNLKAGEWRHLTPKELTSLKRYAEGKGSDEGKSAPSRGRKPFRAGQGRRGEKPTASRGPARQARGGYKKKDEASPSSRRTGKPASPRRNTRNKSSDR